MLLCGGAGRRFGGDKLEAGAPPIAQRAALNLRAGVGPVLAVVPAGSLSLAALLESAGCEVLSTDRTARGMGASLAAAIEASSVRQGWIVALGDMPSILPETIRAVAEALRRGASIAAAFDPESGRRGHPVGFSGALRGELLELDGDAGARGVIDRHADALTRVIVRDPGIFVDIDTAEDLERLGNQGF